MRRRAALLLVATAMLACDDEGGRADCPEGETCSDVTPGGLGIFGAATGDTGVRGAPLAVALGGTQRLYVTSGDDVTSPAFQTAFRARSSGPALAIGAVAAPDVEVLGLEAGQAFVRLLEPAAEALFDRVELAVKPVDRVELVPRGARLDADFVAGGIEWVLLAGAEAEPLVARLFAADGARLADESLTIAVTGGAVAGAREAWDTMRVGATTTAGGVVVRTGDGVRREVAVPVVTQIEEIVSVRAVGGAASTDEPQAGTALFCFRATNRARLVAGAAWSYTSTAGAEGIEPRGSCVRVTATGAFTLGVTASGVSRDFVVSLAGG